MAELLVKGKSSIHGIGVFTNQGIKKGEIFYQVPVDALFSKPEPKFAHIGKNKWVSDERVLNYVNHSCSPNSILDISDKPKLIAKENINSGEEITVDYNETEKNGKKVPCICKSKKCRLYFLRIE